MPPVAGVLSAFGILVSDIKSTFSRSLPAATDRFDDAAANVVLAALEADAEAYLGHV